MFTPIAQFGNAYSPYVPLPGLSSINEEDANNSPLRSVLADKTIRQLDLLISHIENETLEQMPLVVRSIALENRHSLLTILNMLLAYREFLTSHAHADVREKLAVVCLPIEAWVQGQYCVTTPALLVIQSILFSHCEWYREELFESYSAVRAYEELELLGFPELHCYFVAAIIAHQTLLRSAWSGDLKSDPRETLAYFLDEKKKTFEFAQENDQDKVLGLALAETLFEFIGQTPRGRRKEDRDLVRRPNMLRRQLAAALVLHALCLQCRHSRHGSSAITPKIKNQALKFLDHLLASDSKQKYPNVGLAFIHYGRHINQAQQQARFFGENNLFCKAIAWIKDEIPKQPTNEERNISFCFQRVSSKKVWNSIREIKPDDESWMSGFRVDKIGDTHEKLEDSIIHKRVKKTVGNRYWTQKIDRTDYLLSTLGLKLDDKHIEIRNFIHAWATRGY